MVKNNSFKIVNQGFNFEGVFHVISLTKYDYSESIFTFYKDCDPKINL